MFIFYEKFMEIKENLYVPDVEPLFKQNITNLLQKLVKCQSLSFPTKGPSPPFHNLFLTIAIDNWVSIKFGPHFEMNLKKPKNGSI